MAPRIGPVRDSFALASMAARRKSAAVGGVAPSGMAFVTEGGVRVTENGAPVYAPAKT